MKEPMEIPRPAPKTQDMRVLRRTHHKALYVLAKIIRVVTVPPVMVGTLIILLSTLRTDVFSGFGESLCTLLFLAIIPLMAYPISAVIPSIRKKGRDGQRNLAFLLSFVGYSGGMLYALLAHVSRPLLIVFGTYFLSVIVLTVMNKVIRVRASGHACSIVGPIALLACFMGWVALAVGAAVVLLSFWSSVYLRRHTVREYLLGAISPLVSAALMYPLFLPTF